MLNYTNKNSDLSKRLITKKKKREEITAIEILIMTN